MNAHRSTALVASCLATIVAVGVWLRCRSLDESLWLDELHTSWVVADELSDVSPRARLGNQHPLFFYAPLASVKFFGPSEVALRAPSLAAGGLLILGVFLLTQLLTQQPLPALVAAWCVAVDFDSVWYSQEARVYALVQVVALAQLAALWRVAHSPGLGSRMLCVALSALLFYLHYTAALFLIAEAIVFVAATAIAQERIAYRWKHLAIDASAMALLIAPCLWQLREIAAVRNNWISVVPHKSPLEALALFPLAPLGAALLVAVAAAALVVIRGRKSREKGEEERSVPPFKGFAFLALLAIYFLVVALAWLAMEAFAAPLLLKRYLIAVAAMPALAIGLLLAVLPSPARVFAAAVVVALAAYGSSARPWATWDNARRHNEDWRAAVSAVANCGAIDETPLLVRSGFIEADERHDSPLAIEREYCLAPIRGLYRIEAAEAIALGSAPPKEDVLHKLANDRGVVFLTRSSPERASTQSDALLDALNRHLPGWTIHEQLNFGDVNVVCMRRRERVTSDE